MSSLSDVVNTRALIVLVVVVVVKILLYMKTMSCSPKFHVSHVPSNLTEKLIMQVLFISPLTCFLRVWNMDKQTKDGSPTLARTIRALISGGKKSTVMALTAHENMNLIAVGFSDGTVLLIRGNITRDRHSCVKVVHEESTQGCYITGMEWGGVLHHWYGVGWGATSLVWSGVRCYITGME